jgi:phytoene dehydrogenase-like protein
LPWFDATTSDQNVVVGYDYDAVVVGSGPNGLAAAVEIARAGRTVLVMEAAPTIGGGTRTVEATLPGHRHDLCSAIHPLAVGSPYLGSLPLADHGLAWVHPEIPAAHPFPGLRAAVLDRSIGATAFGLGSDASAYRRLMKPIVESWAETAPAFMGPVSRAWRRPIAMSRFGIKALRSAARLSRRFEGRRARGLLAGMGAHAMAPLDTGVTGGVALTLMAAGHRYGWPMARGGSQAIADALAGLLASLGGTIVTDARVRSLGDVPPARAVLFDVSPQALVTIAGEEMPLRYRAALERRRPGPGVFKVDWALSEPIPWTDPACARAGTVHVGGLMQDVASALTAVGSGDHPDRPFVLLAQQSLFDPTRAPQGSHTAWGYCHVPNGSTVDMTDRIETQIERFAPGFRDVITARHVMGPQDLEAHNPNYVGGDIGGGLFTPLRAVARPMTRADPYRVPRSDLYLCSAATPPGPGVHGMCGYHAARSALRRSLR